MTDPTTIKAPVIPDWGCGMSDLGAKTWWALGESGRLYSIYLSPVSGLYVLSDAGQHFKHERLSDAQQEAADRDKIAQEQAND